MVSPLDILSTDYSSIGHFVRTHFVHPLVTFCPLLILFIDNSDNLDVNMCKHKTQLEIQPL